MVLHGQASGEHLGYFKIVFSRGGSFFHQLFYTVTIILCHCLESLIPDITEKSFLSQMIL